MITLAIVGVVILTALGVMSPAILWKIGAEELAAISVLVAMLSLIFGIFAIFSLVGTQL